MAANALELTMSWLTDWYVTRYMYDEHDEDYIHAAYFK